MIISWTLLTALGCTFTGEDAKASIGTTKRELANVWRPEPTQIRIYPTTRIIRRDESSLLQAQIEFFDEMGDTAKASGHFFFELYFISKTGGLQKRLYSWNVPVFDLIQQQRYYEPVTRSYRFPLQMHGDIPDRPVILRVLFTPPTARRLETRRVLTQQFDNVHAQNAVQDGTSG